MQCEGCAPWFPKPWRVDEDWTAEIVAANGRVVAKLPLQRLAEAQAIVAAVNAHVVAEADGEESL